MVKGLGVLRSFSFFFFFLGGGGFRVSGSIGLRFVGFKGTRKPRR